MKKISLFLALILWAPVALAAPLYERSIDVGRLPKTFEGGPVVISVPDAVLRSSSLESLRIMDGKTVLPSKASSPQVGSLDGDIDSIRACTMEGQEFANEAEVPALHDGSMTTTVRPEPMFSPSSCSLRIIFQKPVDVHAVSLETDQTINSITVFGGAVRLGTVKNARSITFSSVGTREIRIEITYDLAPTLKEVTVSGTKPARLLFIPSSRSSLRLVYGDPVPPPMPPAPPELSITKYTESVTLGEERAIPGDDDGDGISNVSDNCRSTPNPDQKDADHDGIGDACDNAPTVPNLLQNDKDFDGVGDATDNCPTIFNPDQRDTDINGVGDVCDDADGDGVINSKDNCPGIVNEDQKDADGDGAGDACQLDRDSDGLPDATDTCRGIFNPKQEDEDLDGIGDACDNCPTTRNQDQRDENSNGIGEACEASIIDVDSDGVVNAKDNCPAVPNPDQADRDHDNIGDTCDNCPTIQNQDQWDTDKNKQGDACTDIDADGLLPPLDNCPTVANADQKDSNNNGIGDSCEDDDNDGAINATDNCRYKFNRDQGDTDADGTGDVCDETDNRLSEQHPWILWIGTSFLVVVLLGIAIRMVMKIRRDEARQ